MTQNNTNNGGSASGTVQINKTPTDRTGLVKQSVVALLTQYTITLPDLIGSDPMCIGYVDTLRDALLGNILLRVAAENTYRSGGTKLKNYDVLPPFVPAMLLLGTGDIRLLKTSNVSGSRVIYKKYYRNALTNFCWKWAGIYEVYEEGNPENPINVFFANICPTASQTDKNNFRQFLYNAPTVYPSTRKDFVACRNGVFDYQNKTLTTYDDPDFDRIFPNYAELSKLPVYHPLGSGAVLKPDANGFVQEPEIVNPDDGFLWKPSMVYEDPFNMDTDVGRACNLLKWQSTQFLIRGLNGLPRIYFFDLDLTGSGHNGKGTLTYLMTRLLTIPNPAAPGNEDLASMKDVILKISVEKLDEELGNKQGERILKAKAIIAEESDSTTFKISKAAFFKILARAQETDYRSLFGKPFSYCFNGYLEQQVNKLPGFKEVTESVISHVCVRPYMKSFIGKARSYIKDDYVLRESVAEWVLYHLTIEMPCLTEYDREALEVLKPFREDVLTNSNSSMQFLEETVSMYHMNFIPTEILYETYRIWCDKNGVSGPATLPNFADTVRVFGAHSDGLEWVKVPKRIEKKAFQEAQPFVLDYGRDRSGKCHEFISLKSVNDTYIHTLDGKADRVWNRGGLVRTIKWEDIPAIVNIDDSTDD